jgi:solute:Na+ symporter, SSS family
MDEVSSSLASIDYVIIGVYMIGVLLIGSYFAKYIHTTGDFFLAGRALPFWAIGMSIVVSDIGAIDLTTGAGAAYDRGIAQFNFDWLGSIPALLLAAFIFVPYYWRAGVYTLPEFLGRRYNEPTRWLHATVLLFFMVAIVSILLWLSAVFLKEVLGWDYMVGIWVTALVVGIYTVSGGLAAVVMTDVMQLVVMFVGTAALLVLSFWNVGGWSGMQETVLAQPKVTEEYFHLLCPHEAGTEYPWPGMVFSLGMVMSTAYYVGNQAVMQRALGARSEWDAKASMITAGFFKLMIPLLVFLPGMAARAMFPDLQKNDHAIPILINTILPAGLKGLMFAAFFAALMSSVDSYLNSCVTVFMGDFCRPVHRAVTGRSMPDRLGLTLSRSLTAVILVGGAAYAPYFSDAQTLYDNMQALMSLFQGPTLAILLLGIFWHRATPLGGLAGLSIGVCITVILNILGNGSFTSPDGTELSVFLSNKSSYLYISFWSFLASFFVTLLVSLVTKPKTPEELQGLVYGSVLSEEPSS